MKTKKCNKCGVFKSLTKYKRFTCSKNGKEYITNTCKSCRNSQAAKEFDYKVKNNPLFREAVLARRKKRNKDNRKALNEYMRKYRSDNRDKICKLKRESRTDKHRTADRIQKANERIALHPNYVKQLLRDIHGIETRACCDEVITLKKKQIKLTRHIKAKNA